MFLDEITRRRPGGHEIVGGVLRWKFKGNWKFAAEQFTSDNYHAPFSHASAMQALMSTLPPDRTEKLSALLQFEDNSWQFSSRLGHGSGYGVFREGDLPFDALLGEDSIYDYFVEVVMPELKTRTDRERDFLVSGHNNLFPSLGYLIGVNTLRVWHPRGPGGIDVTAWVLVDAEAPQAIKDALRRMSIQTFSASGLLEQDDGENWGEIQKVLRGHVQSRYPFNYQMGLGHEGDRGGPEHPGTTGYVMGEMAARGFYRRWLEIMEGRPWAEIPPLATAG
jgi:phenylpropionate dioxygenase-like ring-hydroxylating dioxygenase large terminal subunit